MNDEPVYRTAPATPGLLKLDNNTNPNFTNLKFWQKLCFCLSVHEELPFLSKDF